MPPAVAPQPAPAAGGLVGLIGRYSHRARTELVVSAASYAPVAPEPVKPSEPVATPEPPAVEPTAAEPEGSVPAALPVAESDWL